jgi:hypothetical protein
LKTPLKLALLEVHNFDNDFPYSIEGIARLKKLGYDPTKKEYCGCITAVQILELLKLGVELVESYKNSIEYYKEQKREGNMYRTWVYFYPSAKFLKLKERVENENH